MSKLDLSKLTGRDLFEYYTSEGGEYASVLNQAFAEIDRDLFIMLVQCERTGKRITITEDMPRVIDSPITISAI